MIFVPVLLETAGLPLPGETILLLSGVAASTGRIDPWVAIVVGSTAAIIGDNIGYAIGRYGGRRVVMRLAHIGGIESSLAWGETFFAQPRRQDGLPRPLDLRPAHLRRLDRGHGAHAVARRSSSGTPPAASLVHASMILLGYFFGHSLHVIEKVARRRRRDRGRDRGDRRARASGAATSSAKVHGERRRTAATSAAQSGHAR